MLPVRASEISTLADNVKIRGLGERRRVFNMNA
jgi:hypothetical protein